MTKQEIVRTNLDCIKFIAKNAWEGSTMIDIAHTTNGGIVCIMQQTDGRHYVIDCPLIEEGEDAYDLYEYSYTFTVKQSIELARRDFDSFKTL